MPSSKGSLPVQPLQVQVGLTGGTVFHWTKLPLTTWFLAN